MGSFTPSRASRIRIRKPFTEACGDALKATVQAQRMKTDASGDVFFVNRLANRLQEATAAGKISTIAGAGPNLFTGDGGPASAATFASPNAIAFDKQGNLYVADTNNNRIRRIDAGGIVETVVGDGGPVYNQDPACFARSGQLLAQSAGRRDRCGGRHLHRRHRQESCLEDRAGWNANYDRRAASRGPQGVIVDSAGNIFVTDTGNSALRKISPNGARQTLWTNGATGSMAFGRRGRSCFFRPEPAWSGCLRLSGAISPVAGTGEFTFSAAPGFTSGIEEVGEASAVALDSAGSIYVADQGKGVIERVSHNCALSVETVARRSRAPDGPGVRRQGQSLHRRRHARNHLDRNRRRPRQPTKARRRISAERESRARRPRNLCNADWRAARRPPIDAPIAPGELLRIRGVCMGPFEPVFVGFSATERCTPSAVGTEILFNEHAGAADFRFRRARSSRKRRSNWTDNSRRQSANCSTGSRFNRSIGVQAANPASSP